MGAIESKKTFLYRWEMYLEKRLGSDTFGTLYIGKDIKSGKKVAIKEILKEKIDQIGPRLLETLSDEIEALKECSKIKNPHLLKFYDYFEKDQNTYLVLEYFDFDSGNLRKELMQRRDKMIPEKEAIKIAFQIVIGLKTLSDLQIIHRNLKPAHILKHENCYKIGGFLFAKKAVKFNLIIGTPNYMAPEFFIGDGESTNLVDIWAFGCIVHEMIFKKHPYYSFKMNRGLPSFNYKVPNNPVISEPTKDMLRKCLMKDPNMRINVKDLINHPCFESCRAEVLAKFSNKESFLGDKNEE